MRRLSPSSSDAILETKWKWFPASPAKKKSWSIPLIPLFPGKPFRSRRRPREFLRSDPPAAYKFAYAPRDTSNVWGTVRSGCLGGFRLHGRPEIRAPHRGSSRGFQRGSRLEGRAAERCDL